MKTARAPRAAGPDGLSLTDLGTALSQEDQVVDILSRGLGGSRRPLCLCHRSSLLLVSVPGSGQLAIQTSICTERRDSHKNFYSGPRDFTRRRFSARAKEAWAS